MTEYQREKQERASVQREANVAYAAGAMLEEGCGTLGHHNLIELRRAMRSSLPRPECPMCERRLTKLVPHPANPQVRICAKCEAKVLADLKRDPEWQEARKMVRDMRQKAAAKTRRAQERFDAEQKIARDKARAEAEKAIADKIAEQQRKREEWGLNGPARWE